MDADHYDELRRMQQLQRLAQQEQLLQQRLLQHEREQRRQGTGSGTTDPPRFDSTRDPKPRRSVRIDPIAEVSSGDGDVPQPVALRSSPSGPAWLNDFMRDVSHASVGKQVAIGGVSGWCSGYLLSKVGKAAALALGGSLIIVQVAHWQGLIQINWSNIERSVDATRRKLASQVPSSAHVLADQAREFAQRHVFLAGSFGVGFLLGVAI